MPHSVDLISRKNKNKNKNKTKNLSVRIRIHIDGPKETRTQQSNIDHDNARIIMKQSKTINLVYHLFSIWKQTIDFNNTQKHWNHYRFLRLFLLPFKLESYLLIHFPQSMLSVIAHNNHSFVTIYSSMLHVINETKLFIKNVLLQYCNNWNWEEVDVQLSVIDR